jgi:hypothetical protein
MRDPENEQQPADLRQDTAPPPRHAVQCFRRPFRPFSSLLVCDRAETRGAVGTAMAALLHSEGRSVAKQLSNNHAQPSKQFTETFNGKSPTI